MIALASFFSFFSFTVKFWSYSWNIDLYCVHFRYLFQNLKKYGKTMLGIWGQSYFPVLLNGEYLI